jgi:hypothetical protein
LKSCAERVRDWVKGGGHLFSVAGGGLLDECNQALDTLQPVYGVTGQKLQLTEKHLFAKEGLAWIKPLDEVQAEHGLPALIARQTFTMAAGSADIRFASGASAGTINVVNGQGAASIVGTFPGSAYVQPAIPKRPYDRGTSDGSFNHFIPTQFDRNAQQLILSPVRAAGLKSALRFSEQLIDGTVIESPAGCAIPLANYSGKPVRRLTITIAGCGIVRSVESARRGKLSFRNADGPVSITLPLEDADLIVLRP